MRNPTLLLLPLLALALSACPAEPEVAEGPEDRRKPPAALEGAWRESHEFHGLGGSHLELRFSEDSLHFTEHRWTDMVHCLSTEGSRQCSDPAWDNVYAAAVGATDSTLDLDWRFRSTTLAPPFRGSIPESGRTEFAMAFSASGSMLILERTGGDIFPGDRNRIVLERSVP